ncbi:hypothetical protein E2C01_014936 [Portunus trituberculatus]|uniref:Uncharacterized protein n=1 Tax=Portunus trituberculatus TaxID=210409 RepID=A0A5B7DK11_PORTR|nr:hypothetical protein [Portunus trituberculatus]
MAPVVESVTASFRRFTPFLKAEAKCEARKMAFRTSLRNHKRLLLSRAIVDSLHRSSVRLRSQHKQNTALFHLISLLPEDRSMSSELAP